MESVDTGSLFAVAAVAAVAPFVVDLPLRVRVPVVVVEIVLGIIVGPEVLGLTRQDALIEFLGQFGLAFLFFMAGLEIDFMRIRGRPVELGAAGWLISAAIGLLAAGLLHVTGVVKSELLIGVAISTTALGALMPILRDTGALQTRFGGYVVAAGAAGEFGPIVLFSLLLTQDADRLLVALLLVAFTAVAVGAAVAGARLPESALHRLARTMHSTGQLPMRLALLIMLGLVYLARELDQELILGAFAAGIVVGLASRGEEARPLKVKLEGMGFGFLIPIFFISSGLTFDLDAVLSSTGGLVRVPLFLALFLLCRGAPALLLYRGTLDRARRTSLAFFSATGLPIIVAITQLGVQTGRMRSETAAALVGAGMLSVFVYPLLALRIERRAGTRPEGI